MAQRRARALTKNVQPAEFLNSVRKTTAGCIGHTYPTRWSKGLYTHMAFVISSLGKNYQSRYNKTVSGTPCHKADIRT